MQDIQISVTQQGMQVCTDCSDFNVQISQQEMQVNIACAGDASEHFARHVTLPYQFYFHACICRNLPTVRKSHTSFEAVGIWDITGQD